jgi:hypothetical protein
MKESPLHAEAPEPTALNRTDVSHLAHDGVVNEKHRGGLTSSGK